MKTKRVQLFQASCCLTCAMLVIACGGGSSSPPGSSQQPITVNGKVVDVFNRPMLGVQVKVSGNQQLLMTNGTGAFTFAGVSTPYDLTLIGQGVVWEFRGLSTQEPTVPFAFLASSIKRSSLSGRVTGDNFPEQSFFGTRVAFSSPEAIASDAEVTPSGMYGVSQAFNVIWSQPDSTTGTVHALEWRKGAGSLPTEYYYGRQDSVTLRPAGSAAVPSIAVRRVPTSNDLIGTINPAPGYTIFRKYLFLQFDRNSSMQVVSEESSSATFSYKVPALTDLTCAIGVAARNGNTVAVSLKTRLQAGQGSSVRVDIPTGPVLSSPSHGATGVGAATPFTWSGPGGLYEVVLDPEDGRNPQMVIYTTDAGGKIPDLTALRMNMPRSARYAWRVRTLPALANADALAGSQGVGYFAQLVSNKLSSDFSETLTDWRVFTTSP